MNTLLITGSIAVGVILIATGYTIGTYNTFVNLYEDTKNQWSNILTEYQRRADLIVNLANNVKSYKIHEQETLTQVTKARGGLQAAPTTDAAQKAQMKNMGTIDNFLSRLMVVVEKYPELKADKLHTELMQELRITEDRINTARTNYNDVVRDYNVIIKQFPARTLANMFGYTPVLFYELQDKKASSPPVLNL